MTFRHPARRSENCRAAAPAAGGGAPSRQPGRSPYKSFCLGALLLTLGSAFAQEPAGGTVQITFLPPPLENATYSVGIYEATGHRLVRRLAEFAPESAFSAGLNGLITRWDRRDDEGRVVPPGRYAARGYAVGPLRVEGVAFHGNDWVDADENLRVKHVESIRLAADGKGLVAAVTLADGAAADLTLSSDGDVLSRQPAPAAAPPGKENPTWTAEGDAGFIQHGADGAVLRRLAPVAGDPLPRAIVAATAEDRIYLLEESDGWQRLRALSWVDAKQENGQPISTWQTVFERNIRRAAVPDATHPVEVTLDENPLSPGKPAHANLTAGFDATGSYLQTTDGLRLRRISDRPHLSAARLVRAKGLAFYQFDGAAWDEFSISGASAMMNFDAGDFEVTATGEKPGQKPIEPPDL